MTKVRLLDRRSGLYMDYKIKFPSSTMELFVDYGKGIICKEFHLTAIWANDLHVYEYRHSRKL